MNFISVIFFSLYTMVYGYNFIKVKDKEEVIKNVELFLTKNLPEIKKIYIIDVVNEEPWLYRIDLIVNTDEYGDIPMSIYVSADGKYVFNKNVMLRLR